jgi:hypothetical protein
VYLRALDLLHAGRRGEAVAALEAAEAAGTCKAGALGLLTSLRSAGRGRQPYGARHRWYEIGTENAVLRDQGVPYAERLQRLASKFRLGDQSKVATAIAVYERAREAAAAALI